MGVFLVLQLWNFKEIRILFFRNSIDNTDIRILLFRNLRIFWPVIRILLFRIFFFRNHFLPLRYLVKFASLRWIQECHSIHQGVMYLFINHVYTFDNRYRPHLPVSFFTSQLAFDEETKCVTWMQEINVVFLANDQTKVDCKASSAVLP